MTESPSRWQSVWPELYAPLSDLQRWLLDDALRIEQSDGLDPDLAFAELVITAAFTDDLAADPRRARFAAWYELNGYTSPPAIVARSATTSKRGSSD